MIFFAYSINSFFTLTSEYERWSSDERPAWEKPFEPLSSLLPKTEVIERYHAFVRDAFEKKLPISVKPMISVRILLAMHMHLISTEQAMHLIKMVAPYELVQDHDLSFYVNTLADNLVNMGKIEVHEDSRIKILSFEQDYYTGWSPGFLNKREGQSQIVLPIRALLELTKKCLPYDLHEKKTQFLRCWVDELEIWRNLGTLTLSSLGEEYLADTNDSHKFLEGLYKELQDEALFVSGYRKDIVEGHAMLAIVKRISDDLFKIRLFDTGLKKFVEQPKGQVRASADAFVKPYGDALLTFEDLKKASFLLPHASKESKSDVLLNLFNPDWNWIKEEEESQVYNPWEYSRAQLAGTCTATVFWVYLRSLGSVGMSFEVFLKGKILADLMEISEKYAELVAGVNELEIASPEDIAAMMKQVELVDEVLYERLQKIKELDGRDLCGLRQHPELFAALVSSGINEVTEHLCWLQAQTPSACSLYLPLLRNMIAPFAKNSMIMLNIASPLKHLAKECGFEAPSFLPNELLVSLPQPSTKDLLLKKLCPLEKNSKLGLL